MDWRKYMHKVKCPYCNETFDRDKEAYIMINSKRYAHKKCFEDNENSKTQDQKDKEALIKYIKKLFNTKTISVKIDKQIEKYIKENNYTYSGIHKSLAYFYEIKKNSLDKANGGIGIVPYIYDEAFRYYYSIWEANQKQEFVIKNDFDKYIPQIEEVSIPIPKRKVKKRNLFSFLDETQEEN